MSWLVERAADYRYLLSAELAIFLGIFVFVFHGLKSETIFRRAGQPHPDDQPMLRLIYAFLSLLSFPAWMVLSELLWPPATLLKGAGHALVVVGTIFAVYLGSVHARLLYSWDEWHQYWNNAR